MPTVTCEYCAIDFHVPPNRLVTARACSRACLGIIQSRERAGVFGVGAANPNWKDGRSPLHYRRFLKERCEHCGTDGPLLIHHSDEDRHNNDPSNLITLCKTCHQAHHAKRDATGRYAPCP